MRTTALCLCATALVATASAASPVRAAGLPPASSTATFSGFRTVADGNISNSCNRTFAGSGAASCDGQTFYANGNLLGPGVHVFGSNSATVNISGGASPTVSVQVNLSGGNSDAGAGSAQAEGTLEYFFSIERLGLATPPTSITDIPITFADSGSLISSIDGSFGVNGMISTVASSVTSGGVTFDSGFFVDDAASGAADGSNVFKTYGGSHVLDFHFGATGPIPQVRVDMDAVCDIFEEVAVFASGSCTAVADPFLAFDQTLFDQRMGANTFNLADYYKIVVSSGLEGGGGVPEPAGWALMIAGLGIAGATLRSRRDVRA